eukprot:3638853-Rhodomonas_salina.1
MSLYRCSACLHSLCFIDARSCDALSFSSAAAAKRDGAGKAAAAPTSLRLRTREVGSEKDARELANILPGALCVRATLDVAQVHSCWWDGNLRRDAVVTAVVRER